MPDPVHTDSAGLETGFIQIPVRDGVLPGYQAKPSGGGKFPAVLVIQEIFGVNPHIQDVCRRFARQGYHAIAPELYFRQGDPSKVTDWQEIRDKIVANVSDRRVMSDLDAAAAYSQADELYVTGFCWGGRMVWFYAAHNPRLKAAVAWYGRLAGEKNELHPKQPVEVVSELKCPVLGLYGGLDKSIPQDQVEGMQSAGANIVVYPEADHAFHADYRPTYNEAAARDGWRRMLQWFRSAGA